jgi:hypothetical protein
LESAKRNRDRLARGADAGKMLADIERKGQPSKWITLGAMIALKHFGRIKL